MLRHCVLFRWNPDATDEAKAAVSRGLDEMAKLECVATFVHGPDAGLVDGNWDYVVNAEFDSADRYREYAENTDHLTLIAEVIRPIVSGRAAVQFEV
jgi:hypothetical protein